MVIWPGAWIYTIFLALSFIKEWKIEQHVLPQKAVCMLIRTPLRAGTSMVLNMRASKLLLATFLIDGWSTTTFCRSREIGLNIIHITLTLSLPNVISNEISRRIPFWLWLPRWLWIYCTGGLLSGWLKVNFLNYYANHNHTSKSQRSWYALFSKTYFSWWLNCID